MSKENKPAKEMSNDEIHAEMSELNARMKELKDNIKPIPPRVEVPLTVCNAGLKLERQQKFDRQAQLNAAIKMATQRVEESNASGKKVTK
jgi:hypothetical protein